MIVSSSPARSVLAASALSIVAACGGATPHTASLPRDEIGLLDLAPADAFFAARFDARALRATAAWPAMDEALGQAEPEAAEFFRGTDRAFVVVGGMIEVAPVSASLDDQGEYVPPPEWSQVSGMFGGAVPAAVAILEGRSVALCHTVLATLETHEARGYRYGSRNGIAFATRGERLCVVTFEPVLDALLVGGTGIAPAVRRLAEVGDGNLGIASAVVEIDAPSFRAYVAAAGSEATPDDPPDEGTPDYEVEARKYREFARRLYTILAEGVSAVEWQVTAEANTYTSRTRMQASDADRGVMWREFAEIYFSILRAAAETGIAGQDVNEHLGETMAATRIEARDDGFVVVATMAETAVVSALQGLGAEAETVVGGDVGLDAGYLDATNDSAVDIIANVGPHSAEFSGLPSSTRVEVATSLARAYASRGRFAEALAVLREARDASLDPSLSEVSERAQLEAELCELHLSTGHAAEARAVVADGVRCGPEECGVYGARLVACGAVARAAAGEVEEAIRDLEETGIAGTMESSSIEVALGMVRVLIVAGRPSDAVIASRAGCAGRGAYYCGAIPLARMEALVAAGAPMAQIEAALDDARTAARAESSTVIREDMGLRVDVLACLAGSARAPRDASTRQRCEEAVSAAVELHGESHPDTALARLGLSRVRAASRDAAGAATELRAVDAVRATLGPDHPLRRLRR